MYLVGFWLLLVAGQQATPPPKPLPERVKSVENSAARLWARVFQLSPVIYPELNCNTGSYTEASPENSRLTFPVACEKIEPYLEGFRITIVIGNPYAMRYSDVTGVLYNGKDYSSVDLENGAPFTLRLESGVWNRTTVTLNPVATPDVRTIILAFKLNTTGAGR